ncbi:MAG TPA: protein-L-isoaspartate O-methyltransferase [Deltaproteobacteria bacterium]|nr:MAG: protein-L-isoaspartate O-methyltransferase [Deltaproteobacteria bacterium GWA2_55_82]OGQ62955.1 MAG: protein-L-isoaspartate O-methyltransferase [Deltaproteobacteria bacterium RIFCSPLOWO2_02_FULL_55_12]OIJ72918.1 MAG: protein-L-isoaspartate O-methyltransferase [Deltaproteobacteria bacterium GWC2_55_46]HBG46080.1 protein-L-isoaspartate O-methyltransferase [Deltaproteobacteria bacterium]HCY11702.1 protein-L-isoaspartate O-methyltransferase [Deltaproteobacteria bacterium]
MRQFTPPAAIRVKRDIYERSRQHMLDTQLIPRGITRAEVLHAMLSVPRHIFVDGALHSQAYTDYPLPIGEKQTISQPYMVAFMAESLGLTGRERVLEIGTGSGYQAAVLSMLAEKVYSVERISKIADKARKTLDSLLCRNVIIRVADGTLGWPDEAPFDAIIVAAGSPQVPPALIEQMRPGGRLVIPVGEEESQKLLRITKTAHGASTEVLGGCKFVKLIGKDGWGNDKPRP